MVPLCPRCLSAGSVQVCFRSTATCSGEMILYAATLSAALVLSHQSDYKEMYFENYSVQVADKGQVNFTKSLRVGTHNPGLKSLLTSSLFRQCCFANKSTKIIFSVFPSPAFPAMF